MRKVNSSITSEKIEEIHYNENSFAKIIKNPSETTFFDVLIGVGLVGAAYMNYEKNIVLASGALLFGFNHILIGKVALFLTRDIKLAAHVKMIFGLISLILIVAGIVSV